MIFSPNKLMALAATFATTAQAGGGIFIIQCAPMTVQRADPIVFPGQISPHVHAVAGGTNFGLTTSNEDARNSKETTCSFSIDRSQYWQPQLYHQSRDGKFELIKFLGINAYYLDRVCDYAPGRTNCDNAPKAKAPPRGLRMVTGDPFRKNYDHNIMEHRAQSYLCLDPPAPEGPKILQAPCKESRTQTFFPSCWNGRDLDSADHKSHMSFPVTGQYDSGVCPESHPIAILSVFLEFFHNNRQIADGDFNKWVFAQGDSVGYGIHGDYLQGWTDQGALERSMATCSDDGGLHNPNCSIKQSSINQSGADRAGQVVSRKPEKPAVNEEIGLNGKLDKLPGNNPVFRRSSSAKMRL